MIGRSNGDGLNLDLDLGLGPGAAFSGRTDANAGHPTADLVRHSAEDVVRFAAVAAERVADVLGHEFRRHLPRPFVRLTLDLHCHVHDALQLHARWVCFCFTWLLL